MVPTGTYFKLQLQEYWITSSIRKLQHCSTMNGRVFSKDFRNSYSFQQHTMKLPDAVTLFLVAGIIMLLNWDFFNLKKTPKHVFPVSINEWIKSHTPNLNTNSLLLEVAQTAVWRCLFPGENMFTYSIFVWETHLYRHVMTWQAMTDL